MVALGVQGAAAAVSVFAVDYFFVSLLLFFYLLLCQTVEDVSQYAFIYIFSMYVLLRALRATVLMG